MRLYIPRQSLPHPRVRMGWPIACCLWACLGVLAAGQSARAVDETITHPGRPLIKTIGELLALQYQATTSQALHQVDMEMQVAYFDAHWGNYYFAQDGLTHYLGVSGWKKTFEMGDILHLEGTLRPGESLDLSNFKVTRVAHKKALPSIVIDGNLTECLRLDLALVQATALVERQSETDSTHLDLQLIIEGLKIRAILLLHPTEPIPELAGQLVTLTGVLSPDRRPSPEFLGEIRIGSTDAVTPLGALQDQSAFDQPAIPISDLPKVAPSSVVKIEGIVNSMSTGRELAIIQPQGESANPDQLRISTAQTLFVEMHQTVEVCGVPTFTSRGWRLERPLIRAKPKIEAPSGQAPAPSDHPTSDIGAQPQAKEPEQPIPPEELPVITTMEELWTTDPSRKDWLHPLDMVIHVSYCDPGWSQLWAQSGSHITFWDVPRKDFDPRAGQLVRLKGLVRPSSRIAINDDITIETTGLPEYTPFTPIPVDGNLTDPALHSRMVRLTGLVQEQSEIDQFRHRFVLIVDGFKVTAHARLHETERIANVVGQIVTVEGLFLVRGSRGTHPGEFAGSLWVGRISTLSSVAALANDPRFNIEPSYIEKLFSPTLDRDKEVRLIGDVRSVTPGTSVLIRDDTGLVTIKTAQTLQIPRSGRVEVRGYPTVIDGQPTLSRPLFRLPITHETAKPAATVPIRQTYRIADDILMLRQEVAAENHPVRLNGVVTWSHRSQPFFYMNDSSGGIQVMRRAGEIQSPPAAGTNIVLTGVTVQGSYTPAVQLETISIVGDWTLAEPALISVTQAWTGAEEAQRVKVAGYVRGISRDNNWAHLDLVSASGKSLRVSLPDEPSLDQLVHAIVRVTGVLQMQTTPGGNIDGVVLWLYSHYDIQEVEAARTDPFELPLSDIASLGRFGGQRQARSIIHLRGTVLARPASNEIVLHDGSGGIMVLAADGADARPGEVIDVAGLLGTSGPRTVVREATYRVIERIGNVAPGVIDRKPLLDRGRDCQLVQIQGTVVDRSHVDGYLRVTLVEGAEFFEATLASPDISPETFDNCRPGAVLQLTGAYLVGYDETHAANRFNLHLRSADDITPLLLPSKFTTTHARWLASGLAVVIALTFSWIYFLRRRVQHQTSQIRRQLIKEAHLEDRQRNIIEKASDFIFMLDLSGVFTLFNPAGEFMTGYTKDDVPRLTIFDLIDENDRIGLHTMLLKARPGSEIQPFQTQFRRKDGTLIWVEVAIRYLVEDDRVTGALCVARDITERKAVEEELKRARDAAEANTQAKSAFLANMSHEIRTPMNGVIGMSNLLLDTPLNHDQRDFALTIRNSAESLLTVLNDILDFSKIEAGKLQFETLDFDLTETVDDTVDLLAARAASKHLELAALIPSTLPRRLRGDPGRLRQVLLNLVGNAIKFTEQGEVSVHVRLERETRDGHLLRFEVRDTGIGIGPAEREQLFMPFSQADASTTRKYGGTGLGLAICRQIVEQMNGRIGVHSEPGRGSTFWFTVELARASSAPLEPGPEMLRGVRALGVDDNETNRTVLQHYLESSGVRLDLASSAQEALGMLRGAAAAGDPFHLVLLDFHMPETDGLALARAIHTDERFRTLRMALLTSVDRRFTPAELEAIGITASLAKPIRQRELMHTIQRALNTEGTPATSPAAQEAPATAPLPPMRVLVAEDNLVNQRLTRIQLKKLGYEADLACNGLEVLEAFERVPYDVIFMDCQMPELDGYDTSRRLASHPRRGDVRIVAMTANAMQGDRDKCLESGMDDYLSKPTRPDDLTAALRRAAEAISRTAGA